MEGEKVCCECGYSLSLSSDGSRVAIGAPFDESIGSSPGRVRVYELIKDDTWVQIGQDIY